MAFLEIPGAQLWVTDSGGSKAAVVFVHPAAGTSASWEYQLPAFAGRYRAIAYDLRGWGKSEPRAVTTMSDDIAALADALHLDRFHLVGAAYGGFGALDFALRAPERLLSLVLATTQGGLTEPEYAAARERIIPAALRALPVELRELGPSYRAEDPDGVARWLSIEHSAGARPRQALTTDITYAKLRELHVPTLLVAAGADLLAPPSMMRRIAAQIAGSKLSVIAEAGHSAHWERPDEWNQLVLDFLAAIE